MKKLYLIRHAKSSWSDFSIDDFDRPLAKRGKNDSKFMGKLLSRLGVNPNLIISSPAVRALKTSINISKALDYKMDSVDFNIKIYEATLQDMLNVIKSIDEKYKTVLLIGHNPSLNMLADFLNSQNGIPNIVTCGIAEFAFREEWKNIKKNCTSFISYEYPKKYK